MITLAKMFFLLLLKLRMQIFPKISCFLWLTSLFTNISLQETIGVAINLIFNHNPNLNITKKNFKNFTFSLHQTHFIYKKNEKWEKCLSISKSTVNEDIQVAGLKVSNYSNARSLTCPILITNEYLTSNITHQNFNIINHSGEDLSCHLENSMYLLS